MNGDIIWTREGWWMSPAATKLAMPRVTVWPVCSTCEVAYVLRQCLVPEGEWRWFRDCKHRGADQVIRP